MSSRPIYANTHPSLADLSLYARHDLPFIRQVKLRWHVRKCGACRDEASAFSRGSEKLRDAAQHEAIPGLEADWSRLEREMLGNIAVGVAAARCIENVGQRRFIFRTGWLIAALAILTVIVWYVKIPSAQNHRIIAAISSALKHPAPYSGTELKATADGIAVETRNATLTLMHPQSAIVSLSGSSAVTARYIDEDTGEVTITKVYAQ